MNDRDTERAGPMLNPPHLGELVPRKHGSDWESLATGQHFTRLWVTVAPVTHSLRKSRRSLPLYVSGLGLEYIEHNRGLTLSQTNPGNSQWSEVGPS